MNITIRKTLIALAAGLTPVAFSTAELRLTEDQMDRVTAGIIVTAADSNAVFSASASAEGTTAEAVAEVGDDFARAEGFASTTGPGGASASATASADLQQQAVVPSGSPPGLLSPRQRPLREPRQRPSRTP